jgi:molybdopterin biosynthesis enzyme
LGITIITSKGIKMFYSLKDHVICAISNPKCQLNQEAFNTGGQRSSRVASLSGANGLVVLPQRKSSMSALQAGDAVEAVIISELHVL